MGKVEDFYVLDKHQYANIFLYLPPKMSSVTYLASRYRSQCVLKQ